MHILRLDIVQLVKCSKLGRHVDGFSIGDRVACAGVGYANHAEVVCVPKNLCVKLSDDADLKFASYNSLGSIAMQGVRLADLKLGETCAVIGPWSHWSTDLLAAKGFLESRLLELILMLTQFQWLL